jgi:hypothetical protein
MRIFAAIGLLLMVAACGDAGAGGTASPATTDTTIPVTTAPSTTAAPMTTLPDADFPLPTGATTVVLRMGEAVNFPDRMGMAVVIPEFTLYGDGRVIALDRQAGSSGPVPALVEARLSPAGMQRLVGEAALRGATTPLEHYGSPPLADADSTRFVVDTGGGRTEFGVYALGGVREEDVGTGVSPTEYAARLELRKLRDALRDFPALVGEFIEENPQPYRIEALAIVGLAEGVAGAEAEELPIDLGADATLIPTRIDPVSCLVVTGTQLDAVMAVVAPAEVGTSWMSGGEQWLLRFRPLLPDESGCESLSE